MLLRIFYVNVVIQKKVQTEGFFEYDKKYEKVDVLLCPDTK